MARSLHPALVVFIACIAGSAGAEIEKVAVPCEEGLCLAWWPKLPDVDGWHQDRDSSLEYRANALAPDGLTFANAETVMYAKALYKPRIPETECLEMLIADDRRDSSEHTPGLTIAEGKELVTADGTKLRSLTFLPTGEGNWERVSYAEEGEFYLVFTVSSRTKSGYESATPAYEDLIGSYSE